MDLEWSEVANVSRYEVDIFGPDNYFTNTKVSSNLLRVPFQNLSFGEYSWQVRACKDDIRGIPCGPSGGPRSFTITLPKPEVFNQTVPRSTAPRFGIEWTTPANTERGAFKVGALADLWEVRDSRKLLFSGKKTPTMITNVVEVPALQNLLPKDYALRVKVCTLDEKTCSDWSQAILTVNDGVPPSVLKFNASPLKITVKDPTLTITYGVSDVTFLGNPPASGIARVELWRRLFDKDSTVNDWGDWDEIDRNTGASKTGTFTDKFKVGIEEKYEYGLHVVDNSGNCITQEGERCFTKERVLTSTGLPVIRVEVDTKIESCTISIESFPTRRSSDLVY
jgi:hypothetical protein